MPPAVDFGAWNLAELAAAWRHARPFAHVIVDDLLPDEGLAELCRAVAEEPHWPSRDEIYELMGSAQPVVHPTLGGFQRSLASEAGLHAIQAISAQPVARVEMRSYVFMPGHYLLPHSDCRAEIGRRVAFAYYLWGGACAGGELELFECTVDGGEIVATHPALQIAPRANRLVLFEVSPTSLHQVREVLSGARLSLSGWWYG
jgi:hypothetical protein